MDLPVGMVSLSLHISTLEQAIIGLLIAAVFAGGTVANLTSAVRTDSWLTFWHVVVWVSLVLGVITTLCFTAGGLRDLRRMLRMLRTAVRDARDDGTVPRPVD